MKYIFNIHTSVHMYVNISASVPRFAMIAGNFIMHIHIYTSASASVPIFTMIYISPHMYVHYMCVCVCLSVCVYVCIPVNQHLYREPQ